MELLNVCSCIICSHRTDFKIVVFKKYKLLLRIADLVFLEKKMSSVVDFDSCSVIPVPCVMLVTVHSFIVDSFASFTEIELPHEIV